MYRHRTIIKSLSKAGRLMGRLATHLSLGLFLLPPTQTVNAKVDMVLDSLDKLNQLKKFVDGFTIQIYSGAKREDALSAKAKMVKEMSDLEADIQYTQPKFRVTAGKYFTKLEAQKDLMRLRIFFPNAILVPEKIMIK